MSVEEMTQTGKELPRVSTGALRLQTRHPSEKHEVPRPMYKQTTLFQGKA